MPVRILDLGTVIAAVGLALAVLPGQPPAQESIPNDRLGQVLVSPPLADIHRFPPHRVTEPEWRFARRFRERILEKAQDDPSRSALWRWCYEATEWNYRVWWLLDEIQCSRPGWLKRVYLAELRELLGELDYEAGRVPESIPGHLFHDLR